MLQATHPRPQSPNAPTPVSTTQEPVKVHHGIARSLHFIRRAEERNLREDVLEFILTWGSEFYCTGALHLTVLERSLPRNLRGSPLAAKARDWIVVFSENDAALTCYRRTRAAQFLRKKPKARLSEAQLQNRKAHQLSSMNRIA